MLVSLARDTVESIIELAREFDAQVAPDDSSSAIDDDEEDHALEARRSSPLSGELQRDIFELSDEAQIELVALMWVGRGTFDKEDWAEALETAANERTHATSDYLMGTPMLSDHLEAGLDTVALHSDAED